MNPSISVLLVDDEQMVRQGLRMILESHADLTVVGEAGNGAEAVARATALRPDVVVMDVRMPGLDGISATRQLLATADWPVRVIVVTTFDLDEYVYEALRLGASGFLLKTTPPRMLVTAVREAYAGETMISSELTRRLIEARAPATAPPASAPGPVFDALTPRELDVLRLVARGRSNAEIAADLVVSEATVKTHVNRVLTKLDLRDRTQAAIAAYEHGLVRRGTVPQHPRGT